MGMFDMIKNQLYCPYCGFKHPECCFQTKDFNNGLNVIDIFKVKGVSYNIYHKCFNCDSWIDLNIDKNYGGVVTVEEGKKRVKKELIRIEKIFKIKKKKVKRK